MRPIDAVQALKDINWHHKPTPVSEFESGFNQGLNQAMWIITHAPTLTPPNEPRAGLYGKYTVYKNKDGSLVTDCFILRPAKDPAAVAALRAYAAATDNAELSADIINWVGAEPNEPLTIEQLREMDGEPVYDYRGQEWYVIQEYYDHELTMTDGTRFFDDDEFDGVDKRFYRRPPEGEDA